MGALVEAMDVEAMDVEADEWVVEACSGYGACA